MKLKSSASSLHTTLLAPQPPALPLEKQKQFLERSVERTNDNHKEERQGKRVWRVDDVVTSRKSLHKKQITKKQRVG